MQDTDVQMGVMVREHEDLEVIAPEMPIEYKIEFKAEFFIFIFCI